MATERVGSRRSRQLVGTAGKARQLAVGLEMHPRTRLLGTGIESFDPSAHRRGPARVIIGKQSSLTEVSHSGSETADVIGKFLGHATYGFAHANLISNVK